MDMLAIPQYIGHDRVHQRISEIVGECHAAVLRGEHLSLATLEEELDALVARVWHMTEGELSAIRKAYAPLGEKVIEEEGEEED